MTVVASILAILVCVALSAFFSSSETALFRLRSHDLDEEANNEGAGPSAVAVRQLTSSSSRRCTAIFRAS